MTLAGIAPKVKRELVLKKCPNCCSSTTVREKVDRKQYLLNVPLYKVRRGGWVHMCDRCGWTQGNHTAVAHKTYQLPYCVSCSAQIPSDYTHCASCGEQRI